MRYLFYKALGNFHRVDLALQKKAVKHQIFISKFQT